MMEPLQQFVVLMEAASLGERAIVKHSLSLMLNRSSSFHSSVLGIATDWQRHFYNLLTQSPGEIRRVHFQPASQIQLPE